MIKVFRMYTFIKMTHLLRPQKYFQGLRELNLTVHQPAYVHGGHPFPGVGLGVESLHRVEAAGAVVASCNIEHAVQHSHPGAAASTQHVGNGRPHVALFTKATLVTRSSKLIKTIRDLTASTLPGGHIFPLWQDARSCRNLPQHTGCHLGGPIVNKAPTFIFKMQKHKVKWHSNSQNCCRFVPRVATRTYLLRVLMAAIEVHVLVNGSYRSALKEKEKQVLACPP